MTLDEAIKYAEDMAFLSRKGSGNDECEQNHKQLAEWLKDYKRLKEQESCELLIIKSDILLHQDDRKKWMESIKREKESGVIILPPYFKPLLVPNDIEINIEQEPCEDAISRAQAIYVASGYCHPANIAKELAKLPPVNPQPKMGQWKRISIDKYSEHAKYWYRCDRCGKDNLGDTDFCPSCGCRMVEPQEGEE